MILVWSDVWDLSSPFISIRVGWVIETPVSITQTSTTATHTAAWKAQHYSLHEGRIYCRTVVLDCVSSERRFPSYRLKARFHEPTGYFWFPIPYRSTRPRRQSGKSCFFIHCCTFCIYYLSDFLQEHSSSTPWRQTKVLNRPTVDPSDIFSLIFSYSVFPMVLLSVTGRWQADWTGPWRFQKHNRTVHVFEPLRK